jgi:hypothetical protein
MKKYKKSFVCLLLLLGLCTVFLINRYWFVTADAAFKKVIHYTLTVENKSGDFLENARVRVFAPNKETPWQKLVSLTSSHTFKRVEDIDNNQMMDLLITMPPYGVQVITIQAVLSINSAKKSSIENYSTDPERFIESTNPKIVQLANSLRGSSSMESARNIYEWITAHVKSTGYVRDDLGALYAIDTMEGDCTEQSYLFVALARALGIPARVEGGFFLPERSRFKTGDYHNWSTFLDGVTPTIVDAINKKFDQDSDKYVTFRVHSQDMGEFSLSSQRFMSFDPRVEITLN